LPYTRCGDDTGASEKYLALYEISFSFDAY